MADAQHMIDHNLFSSSMIAIDLTSLRKIKDCFDEYMARAQEKAMAEEAELANQNHVKIMPTINLMCQIT
jgi:hypothetical protein